MNLQQIFAILRARWIVALGIFALVMGGVSAYTFSQPKKYTATASVVLDVKNVDPILGMVAPSIGSPAYLMTQVDIFSSMRVANKVVRALGFHESAEMRERWRAATKGEGSFDAWLGNLVRGGLEARPSRGSNVIYVTYQAEDPKFATAMVNQFVQAYLDTVLELRTSPAKQSKDFFEVNAKSARAALEAAQLRLSEYQQKNGLLVTDERLDIETARLNALSSQVVQVQAMAVESTSRRDAARSQGDKSPDVMSSPLVAGLKSDLLRQQTQLEQLATRLGEAHPQVLELKTGISQTQSKLDAEMRRVATSVGVGNSVNVSSVAQLQASLEEQRAKVMKMKALRDEAAILQRDIDNAQRSYDGVLARTNSSNLESQANQASISALELATTPTSPSGPRTTTNIAVGGLIAVVLAIGVALLVEQFDRRLRTTSEVEHVLQQAVIGSIPSFKKRKPLINVVRRLRLQSTPVPALPHKA